MNKNIQNNKSAEEKTERFDNISVDERTDIVVGRNAVRELLRTGREIDKVLVSNGHKEGSINELIHKARESKIPVVETDKRKLEKICLDAGCSDNSHQGIIAFVSGIKYAEIDDIFVNAEKRGEKPFIIIADKVADPHNLGAIIRSAEACGVHGIIIPKRQAVGVSAVVMKSSAGAAEHIPICRVTNLADTADLLKKMGVWLIACESGGNNYTGIDYDMSCALVLGSEGSGISKLLLSKCDFIASIPMKGYVNSLNVSCAGAVIMYEALRQREMKK